VTLDLTALPDDVGTLHRMIGELAPALDSERARARTEIERLRQVIGTLERGRFGRRSERSVRAPGSQRLVQSQSH